MAFIIHVFVYNEYMKIKFLGAAGTVTGSSYVLTSGSGSSILIDCGMFQGLPDIEHLNFRPYEFDPRRLEGAVLTHAHLDHCGRLPVMLQKGFRGKIYMTEPTWDLTELSLIDTANIAEHDKKMALYDKALVYKTINRFQKAEYHQPFRVGNFKVTMFDAGHIIGSASLLIEDLQPDSEIQSIVFSGDLGNTPEELVKPTESIAQADCVVMESTYGDRLHSNEDPATMLQQEINTIEKLGSTLLIPAFALERTQEILHILMHLKLSGQIRPDTPVFLDSPMAEKATQIYLQHAEYFNQHIQTELRESGVIFGFPGLQTIEKKDESRNLAYIEGPKVIIAGSGMMTGGRIVSHAARYLTDQKNRLLIVGYQGEGTLGRQLMDGQTEVQIDDQLIPVRAQVNATHAMSSHADQGQLIDWLKKIDQVKKVILTHGEDVPRQTLSVKITEQTGLIDIEQPHLNETLEL